MNCSCNSVVTTIQYIEYGICNACYNKETCERKQKKIRDCACGKKSSYNHYYKYGACASCKKEKQAIRQNEVDSKYPNVEIKEKTIKSKKKAIPASLKKQVWKKHFNTYHAICPVCEKETIEALSFHCGHIIPESAGGKSILDNLLPICSSCNLSMGTQHLYEFKDKYFPSENAQLPIVKKINPPVQNPHKSLQEIPQEFQ